MSAHVGAVVRIAGICYGVGARELSPENCEVAEEVSISEVLEDCSDCFTLATCDICSTGSVPNKAIVTVSGIADRLCECSVLNRSYELPDFNYDPLTPACAWSLIDEVEICGKTCDLFVQFSLGGSTFSGIVEVDERDTGFQWVGVWEGDITTPLDCTTLPGTLIPWKEEQGSSDPHRQCNGVSGPATFRFAGFI